MKKKCFTLLSLLLAVLLLSGCGRKPAQEATEETEETEATAQPDDKSAWADDEESDIYLSENAELFGSSGMLSGTIAVVTLLTDDTDTYWALDDPEDLDTYNLIYRNLQIACDWITETCAQYDREVSFVWDWDAHGELLYFAEIEASAVDDEYEAYQQISTAIRENIDSQAVMDAVGANGIIYLSCINTPASNQDTSYTTMWELDYQVQEEVCMMLMNCDGEKEPPSCFAHEILHTFGAVDLYEAGNYGITDLFVEDCEEAGCNDIMFTNDNLQTGAYDYDTITNEITDVTAYYLGLQEYSAIVSKWDLAQSDYETLGW